MLLSKCIESLTLPYANLCMIVLMKKVARVFMLRGCWRLFLLMLSVISVHVVELLF